jgi:O-antigen/teichoic acid export membrane protein
MTTAQLRSARIEFAPATAPVIHVAVGGDAGASDIARKDLKRKTASGALVSVGAQAGAFILRTASLMILARLLLREDFGLVNMATAFTGFLGLLRDAGLSMATVQRDSITSAQISTLFWINVAVGGLLAGLTALTAPMLATFYGDPRLFWVTVAVGASFVFNGAAVQHRAMLQRSMRFGALAIIDLASLVVSIAAGIGIALTGNGYWALDAMLISQAVVGGSGAWLAAGWMPGLPRRRSGVRSMLLYGGTVTLNNLIVYIAYNLDKVLIGRFWGAEALGVYGRAYQLINLPYDNLNGTIGSVALPALSRVQHEPARLRNYFLKGYAVFLSLVIPLTVGSALFADDIILVLLGPKWRDAAGTFRLLAPTIVAFAMANPFAWLMLATGRAVRCLQIALFVTPVLILSFFIGVKYGPQGVAAGFSITMVLSIAPVVLSATRGTLITIRDVLTALRPPTLSMAAGVAAALAVGPVLDRLHPAFVRLLAESTVLSGVYLFTLLVIMKETSMYMGLLSDTGLWPAAGRRTAAETK